MDQRSSDGAPPTPQQFVPLLPQFPGMSSRKDCLRLCGLPFDAKVETVLEVLGEYAHAIVYHGVHMIFNAQGQPAGEAFVQMVSEDAAFLAAMHRNCRHIPGKKQRFVKVLQCSVDDMNKLLSEALPGPTFPSPPAGVVGGAPFGVYPPGTRPMLPPGAVAALPPPGPPMFFPPVVTWPYPTPPVLAADRYPNNAGVTIVLLRGLPYSATVRDILSFFKGFPNLTVDSVHIQRNANGRPNGDAIVAFPTRAEAERAVRTKHRQHIGSRYIELFIG